MGLRRDRPSLLTREGNARVARACSLCYGHLRVSRESPKPQWDASITILDLALCVGLLIIKVFQYNKGTNNNNYYPSSNWG